MLPTSTIFASDIFNSCFNIRYGIFAQFVPTSAKDFIDRKKTISIFRGSKDIYLYRVPIQTPKGLNLSCITDNKIGGLAGFGGSRTITNVIFDQQQYYPGDKVTVRLICDNSQCNTAVKSFKIKLKRKVFARGERVSMYVDTD